MARALVVVGEVAVGGAHVESAGRRSRLQPGCSAAVHAAAARRPGSSPAIASVWRIVSQCWSSWRSTISQIDAVADALAREQLARALAHCLHVCARLGGPERADLSAHRARRLEGVIDARQLGAQQLAAAEAVRDPEVLVGGDVSEVPRERAHDRRVHARELLLAAARRERERVGTRTFEVEQQLLGVVGEGGWSCPREPPSRLACCSLLWGPTVVERGAPVVTGALLPRA